MNILLFGGTGQVGLEVLGRAAAHGATVTAPSRQAIDLLDARAVMAAIEGARTDLVINAAAYTAVDQAESEEETALAINGLAPGAMARACAARDLPLIHLSTDYVFDGDKAGAWREDDRTGPINAYGRTKLAGELAVSAAGGRHLIVRTSWVFSPHGRNFVKTMLGLAGRPELRVVDDQTGRPTAAGDIAEFLFAAAPRLAAGTDQALTGLVHFAGAGTTTWRGLAEAIFALSGGPAPRVVPVATEAYPTPARRPRNSELDCDKVERLYGVRPRPWREGLAETLSALAGKSGDIRA